MKKLLVLGLLACAFVACEKKSASTAMDAKVDSLLRVMTLEEKIGQLNLPSAGQFTTGQALNS
ncbi:MAG: hypothetical protein ACK5WO_03095, partial [Cyclobacteriaceae bacterium]